MSMPSSTPPPLHEVSPLAGLLSYLVPGLGQIYQGRVGKGVLFLVCLYSLFFYGMYLGSWSNVYMYTTDDVPGVPARNLKQRAFAMVDRLHFVGQFPIGAVAWPALWQYFEMPVPSREANPFWHDFMKMPTEAHLNELQTNGDKTWDLGWVFTVIAGMLNVLVIYDAVAGPAFGAGDAKKEVKEPQLQEAAA